MSGGDRRGTGPGTPSGDVGGHRDADAPRRLARHGEDAASTPAGRHGKWATMSRAMHERAVAAATPREKGRPRSGRVSRRDHAVCSFRLAPHEAEMLEKAMRLLGLEARSRGLPDCTKSDALRGAVLAFMNDIVANGADRRHFEAIDTAR